MHAGGTSLIPILSPKPTWNPNPGDSGPHTKQVMVPGELSPARREAGVCRQRAVAASGFQRVIYHQVSDECVRKAAVIKQHKP